MVDGEYKGYTKSLPENLDFLMSFDLFYGETRNGKSLMWRLKQFIQVVEAENKGFIWNWHENELKGKRLGVILQDYWFVNKSGYDTRKIMLCKPISIDELKTGNYKVPPAYDTRNNSSTSTSKSSEKKNDENFDEASIPF